jgi:predicted amidohydrolase
VQDRLVRIALAQLDSRLGDVDANLQRAHAAVGEAEALGAGLVVFPELFVSGYALAGTTDTARSADVPAALAAGSAAVVAGFHERDGAATYNSAVYAAAGRPLHVQRKLYLVRYPPFHEDRSYSPGDAFAAFDSPLGRIAILICNDAWQPMLPSLAVLDGADILLMPSASSTAVPEAEAYWRALTVFYARLLRCYVLFVNRVGVEAGLTFWGGSHVVDPAGEIVSEAPRLDEALVLADLDPELVERRRIELPPESDPRLELVQRELSRISRNQPGRPLS